jgi:hypothetical protein
LKDYGDTHWAAARQGARGAFFWQRQLPKSHLSNFVSSCRVRTAPVSSVNGCVHVADRARHPSGSSIRPNRSLAAWSNYANYGAVQHCRRNTASKASIANKLARATLPASFFLACLAALELEGVVLEEI